MPILHNNNFETELNVAAKIMCRLKGQKLAFCNKVRTKRAHRLQDMENHSHLWQVSWSKNLVAS